jgi:hypothetical protein
VCLVKRLLFDGAEEEPLRFLNGSEFRNDVADSDGEFLYRFRDS